MGSLSMADFLDAFEQVRGYRPYSAQEVAITSNAPATWVLAGPGTGKTEVLVVRTLRLLLIDKVAPESIVLTTFTNRAADNLLERLSAYIEELFTHPNFKDVVRPNISGIWLGTLHSVAHDMLRQFDEKSERMVMLDEAASTFRVLRLSDGEIQDKALYEELNGEQPPVWFRRIHHAARLKNSMNRIIEDHLDVESLESNTPLRGEVSLWKSEDLRLKFLDIRSQYLEKLGGSVDFSIVQGTFHKFLISERSEVLLAKDEARAWPGIQHIIVDEYQDTNPIQEAIYFALARSGATLTVVGDDDQSLYRFRGASVDAMIGFEEKAVLLHPNVHSKSDVVTVRLGENRRSHPGIVGAINSYVQALNPQKYDKARTSKPDLIPKSNVTGDYKSFFVLVEEDEAALGKSVALITSDLHDQGNISDYRQVALLAHSTKETSRSMFMSYANAVRKQGIGMFNPGAKALHKDLALQQIVGLVCMVIDSTGDVLNVMGKELKREVKRYLKIAKACLAKDKDLEKEIRLLTSAFHHPQREKGDKVPEGYPGSWNVLRLFYEIVNLPKFAWLLEKEGGPQASQSSWRLGWMAQLMKSFQNAQLDGGRLSHVTSNHSDFYTWRSQKAPATMHGVTPHLVDRIYRDLITIFSAGGFNEIEDEIQGLPANMCPALTIHQSKGLEFPIVFVCAQKPGWGPSAEHYQEDFFHPFRYNPMHTHGKFTANERAIHDDIRRLFVAMSRAQYACGLCLTKEVYDGIISGDATVMSKYPHIPKSWLETLPKVTL